MCKEDMKNLIITDPFICFFEKQQKLQNLVYALDVPRTEIEFLRMRIKE